MTETQILYIILMFLCGCARIGVKAAYQNGVTDGYGYHREPNNPGYAKAGEYLRKIMAHRWPELRKPPEEYQGQSTVFYRGPK